MFLTGKKHNVILQGSLPPSVSEHVVCYEDDGAYVQITLCCILLRKTCITLCLNIHYFLSGLMAQICNDLHQLDFLPKYKVG